MNTYGKGRYRVWLRKEQVGDDLVYLLGGGQKPHIGAVSVCDPGKKPRSVHASGHYDHVVTEMVARAAANKHGVRCVCAGGVHVDNATKAEIAVLVKNCRKLAEKA